MGAWIWWFCRVSVGLSVLCVIKCIVTRQRSPFRTNGRHNKTERFISVYVVRCWEAIRPTEEKHTKKIGASSQAWSLCKVLIFEKTSTFQTKSMRNLVHTALKMIHLGSSAWYPLTIGKIRTHLLETDATLFTGNPSHIHCTVTQATHCVVQSWARPFPASYFLHIYTTVVFTPHSACGCILCISHSISIVAS